MRLFTQGSIRFYLWYLVIFGMAFPSILNLFGEEKPTEKLVVEPLKGNVNTNFQEFAPSLSADGNTLYFYSKRDRGKYTDIFISKRKDGIWGFPEEVVELNSPYDDQSPFVDKNGQFIIFSSNRDGAMEARLPNKKTAVSRDLYYSNRAEDGNWDTPEQLPSTINTVEIEENPHLAGNTLYFTRYPFSQPEKAKIFRSRLLDTGWTRAEALPSPINDENSTIAAFISEDGKEIYFSSNRPGGYGGYDIYRSVIQGNGSYSEPENLGSEINTSADEAYFIYNKNEKLLYFCRRELGKSFDIYEARVERTNVIQEELNRTGKISLSNVEFDRGSYALLPNSESPLVEIAEYLKKSPQYKVKIVGHTDLTGNFDDNQKLSVDRARSVKKFLVERGISADRIQTEGKGSNQPLIDKKDDESSKRNRRTEFFLTE